MKKFFIWIIVLGVLGGGGYYYWKSKQAEKEEEPTAEYEPTEVVVRDIKITVEATGEIKPRNRLDVKPPIAGRLEELLVDEGDEVEKGQIIGWVSSTERATLLDAALATGEEELEYWKELYKPSPLVSPLKGTIIARNFEPGQSINANDAVVVIADDLIVIASLDETDIGLISIGQEVTTTLDAYPENPFDCEVEKIAYDAKLENNVTMYEIDVRPFELPEFSRSGMTANLEFIRDERKGVVAISSSAIREKKASDSEEGEEIDPGEKVSDNPSPEMREKMMKRMRERGMSDEEIKRKIEERKKKERKPETKKPESMEKAVEVLIASDDPLNPDTKEIIVGLSDGSYTEVVEGLEEGDEVLIEKIRTGEFKQKQSLFLPKPRNNSKEEKKKKVKAAKK